MSKQSFLVLFVAMALFSCSDETQPATADPADPASPDPDANASTPPRMIQPGELTTPLDIVGVYDREVQNDNPEHDCPPCVVIYDMCRVMAPFLSSMAIVEFNSAQLVEIDRDSCDHHRSSYRRFSFKTLGVVAGAAVPEDLTATVYGWTQEMPLLAGDTFLISLYAIDGEWFAVAPYIVVLNGDTISEPSPFNDYEVVLDIPNTFDGLVDEAEAILADYASCQERAWTYWDSPEKVYDFYRKPWTRCEDPAP